MLIVRIHCVQVAFSKYACSNQFMNSLGRQSGFGTKLIANANDVEPFGYHVAWNCRAIQWKYQTHTLAYKPVVARKLCLLEGRTSHRHDGSRRGKGGQPVFRWRAHQFVVPRVYGRSGGNSSCGGEGDRRGSVILFAIRIY